MPTTVLPCCLREQAGLEDDPSQANSNPSTKLLLVGTCQKTLPFSLECVIISLQMATAIKPRSWGERKTELSGSLNVSSLGQLHTHFAHVLASKSVKKKFPSFFKLDLDFCHFQPRTLSDTNDWSRPREIWPSVI